jgi:hypothetical protein
MEIIPGPGALYSRPKNFPVLIFKFFIPDSISDFPIFAL